MPGKISINSLLRATTMRDKLEELGSCFSSSSSYKRRRSDDYARTQSTCRRPRHKQHLYLALDDWDGGYSIHKLDADDILDQEPAAAAVVGEHKLPEPAAVRIALPACDHMSFAAMGTNIFVDTNARCRGDHTPPIFVYNTRTSAITSGPRVPASIHDLRDSMAAGEKLYALSSVTEFSQLDNSVQALSWSRTIPGDYPWDPTMEWSWNTVPSSSLSSPSRPVPYQGGHITSYALHPDGRTIFMSSGLSTYSLDTSNGEWKDLGNWMLPFIGQAFFDADLDAWVGLHYRHDGYVCVCPVVSRSMKRRRPPKCKMLREKLIRRKEEDNAKHRFIKRGKDITLTYMGDGGFALVESNRRSEDFRDGAVVHVTFFGLKYDHEGELRTKVRRATRSYAVSKISPGFCHAAFWM